MAELPEILDAFEKALELERELGARAVECDRALLASALRPSAAPAAPPVAIPPPPAVPARPVTPVAASAQVPSAPVPVQPSAPTAAPETRPATFAGVLEACTKCGLHANRTKVVPGQGNRDSPDFMFIGEAPGADEDRQGLAFVGAAGRFLTKMIAAMGYARDQVYIANVCKCRPPNNRTPTAREMTACLPYLKRQIRGVKPKCLVLLGRTAMRGLFPGMVMRRSVWYEYEGIPTIATFHPAYILRFDSATDPAGLRTAKTEVWNTLKLALAKLGKKPPKG